MCDVFFVSLYRFIFETFQDCYKVILFLSAMPVLLSRVGLSSNLILRDERDLRMICLLNSSSPEIIAGFKCLYSQALPKILNRVSYFRFGSIVPS